MTTTDPADDILSAAHPHRHRTTWWVAAGILVLALTGWWLLAPHDDGVAYRTAEIQRGNLLVTVSATGNLQPTTQVDVGSELSGTIATVLVDDNDMVIQGQELARLDTRRLNDQLTEARASLAAVEAQVLQAQATAAEAGKTLVRLRRMAQQASGSLVAAADIDAAEATMQRSEAAVASAKASVEQWRATVGVAQTNIGLASIRSPINGIVLARLVEPGQTVAAQMQAPILFTLAENLTQMKLEVDVDEADVGQVREGQTATFTVDAWPDREYPSRILRVGFGSQEQDGVISYRTVLTVNNDDLSLRPGMTATAEIETERREDVLLVPNGALRYAPPRTEAASRQPSPGLVGALLPRHRGPASNQMRPPKETGAQQLWVLRDRQPVPIVVRVGASDGTHTEVSGDGLREGMAVIVEQTERKR